MRGQEDIHPTPLHADILQSFQFMGKHQGWAFHSRDDSGQRVQRPGGRALCVHERTAHAAVHGVVQRPGTVHVQQAAGGTFSWARDTSPGGGVWEGIELR